MTPTEIRKFCLNVAADLCRNSDTPLKINEVARELLEFMEGGSVANVAVGSMGMAPIDDDDMAPPQHSYTRLPAYLCHKIVNAAKIERITIQDNLLFKVLLWLEPFGSRGQEVATVDLDWIARHKPVIGGYFVVYEDGYTSFSPARAFEEGYGRLPSDGG